MTRNPIHDSGKGSIVIHARSVSTLIYSICELRFQKEVFRDCNHCAKSVSISSSEVAEC